MEVKINTHIGAIGTFGERYVIGGYSEPKTFNEQLEIISKVDGITGLHPWYPGHPLIESPGKLKRKLSDFGLKVSDISADIYTDKKWKYGALSTHEKNIRKEAVKISKTTIDLAVELGAYSVLIWPGHDGFDYVFQSAYGKSYGYLIESLEEIANYNKNMKICVEYKQKDPRAKNYIEDIGKLLYIFSKINASNLGGALDIGHSFIALERPAESLSLLLSENKLYQIHLNDNYRDADPDLLFGSINFWETLEMFYWLGKTKYDGWLGIDTVTPRNDSAKMLDLAVKFIKDYKRMADKLLENSKLIDKNLSENNYVDNMLLIRELLFSS